jgi:hypothetical protein
MSLLAKRESTNARKGKEQTSKIEAGEEGGIITSPFLTSNRRCDNIP